MIICEHDFAGWFDSLEKDFFNIRSSVTNSCVPVKISCPQAENGNDNAKLLQTVIFATPADGHCKSQFEY